MNRVYEMLIGSRRRAGAVACEVSPSARRRGPGLPRGVRRVAQALSRLAAGAATVAALALPPAAAGQQGVKISDVAHFKGPRINRLQGLGLVTGLAGTGDGGDYKRMIEPLAGWLRNYANPVASLQELKNTKNVAVVRVEATLPEGGIREGDRVDVQVSAIGNCKSLAGGRLVHTPLQHAALVDRAILGFASGPLQVDEENAPVVGTIRGGIVLEHDVFVSYVIQGADLSASYASEWIQPSESYATLVIDPPHQSNGVAAAIAEAINADRAAQYGPVQLAMAMNLSNVVVRVPAQEAGDPVPWLRDIEELMLLLPESSARILINRSKQIIVVDGEVRISPVTFTVRGLTINILHGPDGREQPPILEEQRFVALDPQDQGGPTLSRLVQQLNKIQVPIEDRINVIEELQRAGKIHGRVVYEE
jgi:flagellar P-ring protein precursor FlgI